MPLLCAHPPAFGSLCGSFPPHRAARLRVVLAVGADAQVAAGPGGRQVAGGAEPQTQTLTPLPPYPNLAGPRRATSCRRGAGTSHPNPHPLRIAHSRELTPALTP
eukprot:3376655-Prymnesium_polylepis.1